MHPGLMGALARQKRHEILHREEVRYNQLSRPSSSTVRGPGPLVRVQLVAGLCSRCSG